MLPLSGVACIVFSSPPSQVYCLTAIINHASDSTSWRQNLEKINISGLYVSIGDLSTFLSKDRYFL